MQGADQLTQVRMVSRAAGSELQVGGLGLVAPAGAMFSSGVIAASSAIAAALAKRLGGIAPGGVLGLAFLILFLLGK